MVGETWPYGYNDTTGQPNDMGCTNIGVLAEAQNCFVYPNPLIPAWQPWPFIHTWIAAAPTPDQSAEIAALKNEVAELRGAVRVLTDLLRKETK